MTPPSAPSISPANQSSPLASAPSIGIVIDSDRVDARHAAGEHAFGLHLLEVFEHLRLPYRRLSSVGEAGTVSVLILAETDPTPPAVDTVSRWVEAGGTVIITAATAGWDALTGATTGTTYQTGLVEFLEHAAWPQRPSRPLRAIGGCSLIPDSETTVLARWAGGDAAITLTTRGSGRAITSGVDLAQTIVRLRQGMPVHADGKPSADGSAPVDDDILKCEDGTVFDLDADRVMPPGTPPLAGTYPYGYPPVTEAPLFDLPQADLWWVALVQLTWWSIERAGLPSVWLHYWPAGVPAMAHMSHDADGNRTEDGQAALAAFAEAGVKVTWCQVFPGGYDPEIYRRVTADGHEQALHYNAMADADIASWGWPQFRAQYAWAQAITGTDTIISNKNHYTRWEGWTEFYSWCERVGIKIDESRGPSKIGDVGFTFGASHLSFPMGDVDVANRPMDVINLPLHTQDLAWAGHISCRDVILDGAELVHGVAHFLFHGPHLRMRPATRAACPELAQLARDRGMRWWTAGQISDWERGRRGVELEVGTEPDGTIVITATSNDTLTDVGVLISVPGSDPASVRCEDPSVSVAEVTRHGQPFAELSASVQPGRQVWRLTT